MAGTITLLVLSTLFIISSGSEEVRLINQLLKYYPTDGGRPVNDSTKAVNVNAKLSLLHIHSLDKVNKVFTVTAWLNMVWKDEYLQWTASDVGDIDYILLDKSKIWTPDIVLLNTLEKPVTLFDVKAVVKATGEVTLVEPYKFTSSCPDAKADDINQVCSLKFGSWAYDTSRLSISSKETRVDAGNYLLNADFELFGTSVEAHEKENVCCPGTKYGDVTFTIKLKERPKQDDDDETNGSGCSVPAAITTLFALLFSLYLTSTVS